MLGALLDDPLPAGLIRLGPIGGGGRRIERDGLNAGVGLLCCLYFVWYGALVTVASYSAGSIVIKTLITPEWWTLAPLPVGFVLLGIEFIFRMHRLSVAGIGLRDDAVSAA